jgi:hypothetical protein
MVGHVIYARNVTYVSLVRRPDEPREVRSLDSNLAVGVCGTVVRAVIYGIYGRNVIYEAAVARTASSASGVSTSSNAAVSVGTSATASW